MSEPPLRTSRLALTPLDDVHLAEVKALFSDPGVRAIYGEGRDTDARVAAWIAWSRDQRTQGVPGFWALATHADPFVGICGLLLQTLDGSSELEVGYVLRDRARGQGYATEAARFARDYAFSALRAERVISIILPTNTPSIRVAERNGMTFERQTTFHGRTVNVYAVRKR